MSVTGEFEPAEGVRVVLVEQRDRRLGRQLVHDERSRGYTVGAAVDPSTWRTKSVRVYDPIPNPNQPVGNCTACAKAMQFNAAGNRITGKVLNMQWALERYRLFTRRDPFPGAWEPDDTGSSGLASCQVMVDTGEGGEYRWNMAGADGCVQLVMGGVVTSNGTWWYESMFDPDSRGRVEPSGDRVGGHQWVTRGYDADADETINRCWWGPGFRDFRLKREHHNDLLMDDGDCHTQVRAFPL